MECEQSSATGCMSPFHISYMDLCKHNPSRWPEEQILIHGDRAAVLILQTMQAQCPQPLTYKTNTCTNVSTDLGSSNISVLSSLMMPVLKLRTKSTMKRVSETTLKMIHEGVFSSLKNVMPTGRTIKFPIINTSINRSQ